MKFLLTNDDGIDAPGLAALEAVAAQLGDYTILAPSVGHSGCGHQVTTNRPLVVTERGPKRRCVDGTPADCVRLGLTQLHPETDCVLSGINAGANLGADVYISGTAAAAREATFFGRRAIAISHYRRRELEYDWPRIVPWIVRLLHQVLAQPAEPGIFHNINVPHLDPASPDPKAIECFTDTHPLPVAYREDAAGFHYAGNYHLRPRSIGSDIDVCFSGRIAVAKISLG